MNNLKKYTKQERKRRAVFKDFSAKKKWKNADFTEVWFQEEKNFFKNTFVRKNKLFQNLDRFIANNYEIEAKKLFFFNKFLM